MESVKIFTATGNVSYALSQAAKVLVDFFVRKFPKGYFRDYSVGTESFSVREQRRLEEAKGGEFVRPTPCLSIRPVYTLEETIPENPIENRWKHVAMNHGPVHDLQGNYQHIFFDTEEERYVFTLPKFHRFNFDVSVRTDGEMAMWDAMAWLKHGLIFNEFFYLNRYPMAVVIPNVIVWALAGEYGLNMEDPADRADFLGVLRKGSHQRINEVVDPAKARPYYVFGYTANLMVKFESLPTGEVQEQEQSRSRGEIGFSGQMQFHTPTNFAVETRGFDPSYGEVIDDLAREQLTPSISIERLVTPPPFQLEDGRRMVFFKGFVTEAPATTDESVPVLGPEKNPWPIRGGAFVDNGPGLVLAEGWNAGIGAAGTSFSEETSFVDVEGESTQLCDSSDGEFEVQSNDFSFTKRNRRHRIRIRAACDVNRARFDVVTGNYESEQVTSRIEFSWPSRYQTFELTVPAPAGTCSLTIRPSGPGPCRLWLAEVSVVDMLGTVLSTLTEDLVHLSGHLGPDLEEVIDRNIEDGTDNDAFFAVRVIQKGSDYLDQSRLSMDWEKRVLTVQNPLFNTTHYVAMYADLELFKAARGVEG